MQWYYSSEGNQHGPVSQGELSSLIQSGAVRPSDLVWQEGMAEWQPVASIAAFSSAPPPLPDFPGHPAGAPPLPATFTPGGNPFAPPLASIHPSQMAHVPNYMWQSIVATLICCLPFGIPAIVYASKVEPFLRQGNVRAAQEASAKAKMWCNIAAGVGFIVVLLWALVGGMSNSSRGY